MHDPSIILTMLNSQIVDIKANQRFATYISSDGSLFVMGRDFRPIASGENKNDGAIFGIPKYINLPHKIHTVAIGNDHMLTMSVNGSVFSMGSNQYGQLGVENNKLDTFFEHPMNLQKLYYSQGPIKI